MAEERTPRHVETRADDTRPNDDWVPNSKLPAPDKRDGWHHRWIRTHMLNSFDGNNVSSKFREGWEPVKASEYPEIKAMPDVDTRFPDGIEIGGLLLCRIPVDRVEKRQEYHRNLNERQIQSVDENYLRDNDPRMPKLNPERSTRTTFGRG